MVATRQESASSPSWSSALTTALPRDVQSCYELFCAIERTPEWLPVVRSAVVNRRDDRGRPDQVSFLARLVRATIGYTCTYEYTDGPDGVRQVSWRTRADANFRVKGIARFAPLTAPSTDAAQPPGSAGTCLMLYTLDVDLGPGDLPTWCDTHFAAHPASAALAEFREFVLRAL